MLTRRDQKGLYIHIPFCARKCAYCDFLSAPESEEKIRDYFAALTNEAAAAAQEAAGDGTFTSVYFGGGTPGLPDAQLIADFLQALRGDFQIAPNAEITLETNPGLVTEDKLKCYRQAGINRLSLGVQSMHDEQLKLLGRIHTVRDVKESVRLARQAGFTNLNLDLMEALPGQTEKQLSDDVQKLLELEPEHISVYSLIVEDGTYLASHLTKYPKLPDEDAERAMYWQTAKTLAAHGFKQYEISNFARPGYFSRHNTSYWERREYIGLGLGASSFRQGVRWDNTRDLSEYIKALSELSTSASGRTSGTLLKTEKARKALEKIKKNVVHLSRKDAMAEFFFLGLRKMSGVKEADFYNCFDVPVDAVYADVLERHVKDGTLLRDNGTIRLSHRGIDVSNYILCDFL